MRPPPRRSRRPGAAAARARADCASPSPRHRTETRRMFSHQFYNVVHVVGIALLAAALGGMSLHAINGGTRRESRSRGLVAALHGTGALLVLVGGFGMLARLGVRHGASFPG